MRNFEKYQDKLINKKELISLRGGSGDCCCLYCGDIFMPGTCGGTTTGSCDANLPPDGCEWRLEECH